METPSGTSALVLSFDGRDSELSPLLPQVTRLKRELARKHGRRSADKLLNVRLEKAAASRSLKRLMALMAPITAVINVLALYLHKLSPPTIETAWISNIYLVLLPLVYIAAILLLLVFTLICILYTGKYGLLLLRKL